MKNRIRQIIAGVLAVIMLLSLCIVAFADTTDTENTTNNPTGNTTENPTGNSTDNPTGGDTPDTHEPVINTLDDANVMIKVDSTGNLGLIITNYIAEENNIEATESKFDGNVSVKSGSTGSIDIEYTHSNGDKTKVKANYTVVEPEGFRLTNEISNIRADDKNNQSESSFLSYINSNLKLTPLGDDYNNALGSGKEYKAANFTWNDCNNKFIPYGDVEYTFQSTFNGSVLTRTVKVTPVATGAPTVYVDYDECKIRGTTTDMEWSLDRTKWSTCQENMQIRSDWFEKTVYFRYPAKNYRAESSATDVYVPYREEKPKVTLALKSTSHSVTITNCWDFDNAEYSIDGSDYVTTSKDTYTFNNLESNKDYTVYVRTASKSNKSIASEANQSRIKTTAKTEDGIQIDYTSDSKTASVKAVGTVESRVSSTSLTGDYTTTTLNRFQSIVNGYIDKKLDTTSELKIEQYKESNETNDINSYTFSMPMSSLSTAIKKGNLEVRYLNDYLEVYMDNSSLLDLLGNSGSGTLTVNVKKPTSISGSSNLSWLRGQYNNGRPVYDINVKSNSNTGYVTYILDYKLSKNETVSGLEVYNVKSNGDKTKVSSTYDNIKQELKFTSNLSGYFVVASSYSTVVPFRDVTQKDWFYEPIDYCYNNGIFNGVSNTEFAPNIAINNAMIYTLIGRISGEEIGNPPDSVIKNYKAGNTWFLPSLYWATQKRLLNNLDVDAEGRMPRSEIAVVIYNFMKYMKFENKTTVKYDELYNDLGKEKSDVQNAAAFLNQYGVMVGVGDKKFNPNSDVSRAEMAAILSRVDKLLKK